MKHKTFFTILVMAVLTMGCLKVQKKTEVAVKVAQAKPAQAQPKQVNSRELRLDDVFVEFVGQAQPDLYDVVFSWPETRDRVRISLDGQTAFAVNTSERPSEGVRSLQGGRKISVLVEILDQQYHIITSETRDLEVPKDYIFPNQFKLTNHMKIQNERVFLNNSVITTENFNLEIQTKKLIVLDKSPALDKSRIQNFIPGTKAQHGSDGRNGGFIKIEADCAEGDLTFAMNSEAGGDALKGIYHTFGILGGGFVSESVICPLGTNGFTAGRNGDLKLKIRDITNFRHYVQETLSEGGKLAPMLSKDKDLDYPSLSPYTLKGTDCPQGPSLGGNAQLGKNCLIFSGQAPQQGCE